MVHGYPIKSNLAQRRTFQNRGQPFRREESFPACCPVRIAFEVWHRHFGRRWPSWRWSTHRGPGSCGTDSALRAEGEPGCWGRKFKALRKSHMLVWVMASREDCMRFVWKRTFLSLVSVRWLFIFLFFPPRSVLLTPSNLWLNLMTSLIKKKKKKGNA